MKKNKDNLKKDIDERSNSRDPYINKKFGNNTASNYHIQKTKANDKDKTEDVS